MSCRLIAVPVVTLLASLLGAGAAAAEPDLFADHIAPLLGQRCAGCHNPAKKRGGLDLTTAEGLQQGGDSGLVVKAGAAADSALIRMVSGPNAKMPKQGPKLTADEIGFLRQWIDAGAAWPKGVVVAEKPAPTDEQWWSLRPLTRPPVPSVRDTGWVRTPIDAFLLSAMEQKGLRSSPPADKTTLLRRVTFDLIGLPPTPEEIDAFLKDESPDAYEKVVHRLLASPRYGERWGRHWLDLAHYADTHGYDKDKRRDHAWPYRDYVIRAFNQDKPYKRFIQEQLAGDVLYPGADAPGSPSDGVVATGFITTGPWDFVGQVELRERTVDKEKTRVLDRDDMVVNAISTFDSMTVHCARCHDHKFDPIPQRDYYRLQAVFAGVERGDRPFGGKEILARFAELQARKKQIEAERTDFQKKAADPQSDAATRDGLARTAADLAAVDRELQELAKSNVVYAVAPIPPRPIWVLHRGDVEQKQELVTPGALSCVNELDPDFKDLKDDDEGGRRAALAAWIIDDRNPLTWRSIVNRIWHYHFGRGIVDTPSDFGRNGSRPTHPELLDWLAVEFRDGGGSFKKLQRLIVLSAAYRQSSADDAEAAKIDADDRFLWRMTRQRLDAEEVRDAVLAVSGKLDLTMGGPGFELFRFKDDHSPVYDHTAVDKINDPGNWRRTVYRFTVRSVPNPFLECMDCADPNINTPVRNTTLTALQALALLNDPFMLKQAECFAERLQKMSDDPAKQVEAAYRLAYGRPPTVEERDALVEYAKKHGLAKACRVLFNANEFVFVD
ncbi:MAG TPA: PSD1 and planctomycete cytochrome C domain-containing protein [Gemmataceae bacterium]|nr:PSD1 and planctomycete cytochrome C domain-containing protein [Gemmataceae bacterium]